MSSYYEMTPREMAIELWINRRMNYLNEWIENYERGIEANKFPDMIESFKESLEDLKAQRTDITRENAEKYVDSYFAQFNRYPYSY